MKVRRTAEQTLDILVRSRLFWAALCFLGTLPWLVRLSVDMVFNPQWTGRDFDDLWVAGRMVIRGDASAVFDIQTFQAAHMQLMHISTTHQLFSYPPYALFLTIPFGALPYPAAFLLWDVLTAALFILAARPYLSEHLPWWVSICTPASIICLGFGQYGLLTSALFLFAWRGSGIAAAILTFKPHIGFLIAARLLPRRKAFFVAVAGFAALIMLSIVFFGVESWVKFAREIVPHQLGRVAHGEHSLVGLQVTAALGYGVLGQLAFGIAALILLVRCFNVFTAATATFLIVPYGFHYDMPAATLGFAYLMANPEARAWRRVSATVAFCTPALAASSALVAPVVLLLGLFAQSEAWRSRPERNIDEKTRTWGDAFRRRLLPANVGSNRLNDESVA